MFAKAKSIFREINTIFFLIFTCEPSMYMVDHPDLTVSNFMEESMSPFVEIGLKSGYL